MMGLAFLNNSLTVEDGMEAGKKQGGDIGEEAITKV